MSTLLHTIYKKTLPALILLAIVGSQNSCKKYLDKKPVESLAVPANLNDLQSVLDNQRGNTFFPHLLEFTGDNFFLTTPAYNNLLVENRKNYTWQADADIAIEYNAAWGNPYVSIYEANFVLQFLPTLTIAETEKPRYNNLKGWALFQRGFTFHSLAQLFCRPYSSTATTDMGLVLRLRADLEEPLSRASVEQTYARIIGDLKEASELLPETQVYSTRPTKTAAYAALARVYLSMRDYVNAELYADKSLQLKDTLLDYNSLDPVTGITSLGSALNNPEVLFLSGRTMQGVFDPSHTAKVDTVLYQSFHNDDLRKMINYSPDGAYNYWRGNYYTAPFGLAAIFNGLATDEMYLVRAECRARRSDVNGAMSALNALLRKRWKTNTFTDLTAANAADALNIVLEERRKGLAFRGLRWSDLRRFNLEGANITLKRIVEGNTYTLPPNDPRWVLLIPGFEIQRAGIAQNPR